MKETPLSAKHIALGAKMVEFAGYNMPVVYTSINEEHRNVRDKVGVFDVSHMGEFHISGQGAYELVQFVTSNDVSKLYPGKVLYSCLPNETGGIVDDLLVYMMGENDYMLVVNASNMQKDWDWINSHNKWGAVMKNLSDDTALLAVQGPLASSVLQSLTDTDLASMEYYTFRKGSMAGIDNLIISATGYTGAGGFELYVPNENAEDLWNAIFEAGKSNGIMPIGLGARDTLRLEMGYCLYGNDIDDNTSPLEAGLGWITKLKSEANNFINKQYFIDQRAAGLNRKLIGLEMLERGIPRHEYPVFDADNNEIGHITSGTQAPSLNKAIAMAYLTTDQATLGNEVFVGIRQKKLRAKVVKFPFYKAP